MELRKWGIAPLCVLLFATAGGKTFDSLAAERSGPAGPSRTPAGPGPCFVRDEGAGSTGAEYVLRDPLHSLFFLRDGLAFDDRPGPSSGSERGPHPASLGLEFVRSSGRVRIEGVRPVDLGDGTRAFASLLYREVWPGVDLAFHAKPGGILKYEFLLEPGADPGRILLAWRGARELRVSDAGDLVVRTAAGQIRDERPVVFQTAADGRSIPVEARYALRSEWTVGFEVGGYDPRRPLVLDPTLVYSTYLGGTSGDEGHAIAVDSGGNAYVAGYTNSNDFPRVSAYQTTYAGGSGFDAFVTKLGLQGSTLVYSTYLGGSNSDLAMALAVSGTAEAYLAGITSSSNFPTLGPYQATLASDPDAFVTKLSRSGSALVYSTYLGGTSADGAYAVDVMGNDYAYVAGDTDSTNFPTQGAYQGTSAGSRDAFVTQFTNTGELSFSTYLGGSASDQASGVAVICSAWCDLLVTGETSSADFPTASPYQGSYGGGFSDAFVSHLTLGFLGYSTYLGGSGADSGLAIAENFGRYAVTGHTDSTDFPTSNAYQSTLKGSTDAFVTAYAADGVRLYSTYLGGSSTDSGNAIAINSASEAYVTGFTWSTDFPIQAAYQAARGGGTGSDAFVTEFLNYGWSLGFSTYLGGSGSDSGYGIAVDPRSYAFVTGRTAATDFPVKNAYQAAKKGAASVFDTFAAKFPGRGVWHGSADTSGDHQDEIGVFRNGMWFLTNSPDFAGVDQTTAFGSPTPGADTPDLGEFECAKTLGSPDGQTDLVILRKAFSTWQVTLSPDFGGSPDLSRTFGTTAHKRISTRSLDTNGDGCSDIGVFRDGCFDVLTSSSYSFVGTHVCFGPGTDSPLAADLDGDRKSDLLLWRSATHHYSYRLSTESYSADHGTDLGAGAYPLVGDWNGDGLADLGSYDSTFSTFRWSYAPLYDSVQTVVHGVSGDVPIVADVSGDGISDIGIFRNGTARWWFRCSPAWSTTCLSQSFGVSGDQPIYGKPPGFP